MKKMVSPEMEFVKLENEDVIATSETCRFVDCTSVSCLEGEWEDCTTFCLDCFLEGFNCEEVIDDIWCSVVTEL
ncbi:MAG: hypothetical protein CW338_12275 [Clostridiales bacterium]|nr:hypothetical protein [Clostridiales bacterium]